MFFSGGPDSSGIEDRAANTSNFWSSSVGVGVEVEGVGVAELLDLFKSLGQSLPLGFADLYVRDDGVDLQLRVDQGHLFGGVPPRECKEFLFLGLRTSLLLVLVRIFFGGGM